MVPKKSRETILVERAIKKDKKALVELCNIKGKQVLFTCVKILGNYHDGEDAAQEVILRMYKNIKKLNAPEAFNAWLNRLTTNVCNNIGRKSMKHKENVSIEDVYEDLSDFENLDMIPLEYVETEDNKQRVIECIDKLPIQYARSIRMYYYDEMSYAEIAEALDVTPAAVRMYIHKGKVRLKEELGSSFKEVKLYSAAPLLALGPIIKELTAQSIETTVSDAMLQSLLKKARIYGPFGLPKPVLDVAATVSSVALTAASVLIIGQGVKEAATVVPPPQLSSTRPSANGLLDTEFPQGLLDGDTLADGRGEESESEVFAHTIRGRIYIQRSEAADPYARNGLSGIQIALIDPETEKAIAVARTLGGIENGLFQLHTFEAGQYKVRITLPESSVLTAGNTMLKKDKERKNTYWLLNGESDTYDFIDGEPFLLEGIEIEIQIESRISGSVSLLNNTGELLLNIGNYLPNIKVNLMDPQGRVIDTTSVLPNGSYIFENPMVSQNGQYKIQYSLGNFHGITQQIVEQTVGLRPGRSTELDRVAIADKTPPAINLELHGGDCDCGHINPVGASIEVYDTTGATVQWSIDSAGSGASSITGSTEAELNAALKTLENGSYTLTIIAKDAAGNSNMYSEDILIKR